MMNPKGKLTAALFSLLVVLMPQTGRAQQQMAGDSLNVDLDTAIEIALNESPSVQIAGKEIQKKEFARKETRASLLPNLGVGASYTRTLQKQKMSMNLGGQSSSIKVGSDNQWGAGLNLSLPLIAPALWQSMQLTQTDIELAAENARSSTITLIREVKNAYYSLLMAKDSYQVLKASYDNAEFSAKIATDKFNQGLVSEFDKLRADVQLKNQKPGLIAAEKAVELATLNLKVQMGLNIDEPIRFTGNLSDFEDDMIEDIVMLASDTTLIDNSDLTQIDLQLHMLDKAQKITRSQYLPSMNMTGAYQWSSLNDDFRIGHYRWFPYATLGVTLQIPIYAGGMKRSQVAQSKIDIEKLELQRKDVERQLELSVQNSLISIERSIEEVDSNRESVKEAERAYSISQKRYEVGSGNLLELNDSELALTQSRLAYNQSIHNYLSARADLEATLGRSVEAKTYPTLNK